MSRLLRTLALTLLLVALAEIRVSALAGMAGARHPATSPAAPRPCRAPAAAAAEAALLGVEGAKISPAALSIASSSAPLALRAAPVAAFPPIATLPPGVAFRILSTLPDGSWLEVAWNGQRGWLPAQPTPLHSARR